MLLQRFDEVLLRDEQMLHVTEHPRLLVTYMDVNVWKSYCRLFKPITYKLYII